MLLETKIRKIEAKFAFDKIQKYDLNSSIYPDLNEKVTMWLFVKFARKTSPVAHDLAV